MKLPESTLIRLKNQHLVLENLFEEFSTEELETEIFPGKWTAKQQLAHLVSYQPTFVKRLRQILESFNAKFEPYQADTDPEFLKAQLLNPVQLISALHQGREEIVQLLVSLDSGELYRRGSHPVYGNLTIPMWTEFYLLHEAHHFYCIFRMLSELKNNRPNETLSQHV